MRQPDTTFLRAKDTLRKIRYTMRREAGLIDRTLDALGSGLGARPLPFHILPEKPVRHLSDAVFGPLERAAKIALQEPEDFGILSEPVKPISSLLRDTPLSNYARGPSDFVTVLYRYIQYLLRGLPVENFYVSEHAIESARQNLYSQYGVLISGAAAADRSRPDEEIIELQVQLCATLACEVDMARPIRRFDPVQVAGAPSQPMAESPDRFCATTVGLALAIASKRPAGAALKASKILESSGLVSQARFAQFTAAMESSSPVERLAGEFTKVLPYLP